MKATRRNSQKKRAAKSSNKENKVREKKSRLSFYERLNLMGDDGKRIWWMEETELNKWHDDDVTRRRNWLDMPIEIMILIFTKLGTLWILGVAQHVCSIWQQLAKQPVLYRSVVIHKQDLDPFHTIFNNSISIGSLGRLAFDRSCGQAQQFSCSEMRSFAPKHLLYLSESSSAVSLKSLRLGKSGHIEIHGLISIIKKFTSLEELYLFYEWDISKHIILEIGHAFRKLKYLQIGTLDFSGDLAFVIAENMCGLRRLHLSGDYLTVEGFQALLNGCPCLEYLRLRGFSNLSNLDAGLVKKQFTRISNIRILTKGPEFDEYEFDIEKIGARQTLSESSLTKAFSDGSDYTLSSLYREPFQDEIDVQAYCE